MTSGWHGLPVGRRVLLAEDDLALREILATVLSESGYQVGTVSDGSELRRLLRQAGPEGRFDLIVTDVNMPGGSGLDVIELLRQNGDTTPVIVVTAFPQADIRQRAKDLGLRLLAKPFELETLRAAVDWAIRVNAPHQRRLSWSQ
ncbi:MAG: response regulator [Pseudomonadota bacterium]